MLHHKGIALLQVLLITAIITILALYFSITAREQVKLAQLSSDRAEATLAIKTAQSRLFLALLTEFREPQQNSTDNLIKHWNFYGEPFELNNIVAVQIQDQSGLISVNFPDSLLVRQMFQQNNLDPSLAPTIIDSLLDWQDADRLTRLNGAEHDEYVSGPRNGVITLKSEMARVRGVSVEVWQKFASMFTVYQRGPFNPMSSPAPILAGLIGNDRAYDYVERRKISPFTAVEFSALTGLQESMEQLFYPSDVLDITLRTTRGGVKIQKRMMVELKPYAVGAESPVDYLEIQW
jgi:general secretion pathway protein K